MEETREKLIKEEKKTFWKRLIMIIVYSVAMAALFMFIENYSINTRNNNKLKAEAIVEERADNYLLLAYEVSGEKINVIQKTENSSIKVGDKYDVLYDKETPHLISQEDAVTIESSKNGIKMMNTIIVVIAIGAIIFLYIKMKQKTKVLQDGMHIKASYFSKNFGIMQLKWKDEKENQLYYFNVRLSKQKIKENSVYDIYMDKSNPKNFIILFDVK